MTFSCDFYNTTSNVVTWGNAGGEMCILVTWTDSPYIIFNAVSDPKKSGYTHTEDGVDVYEGHCGVAFINN
jgi:hypothetical protein